MADSKKGDLVGYVVMAWSKEQGLKSMANMRNASLVASLIITVLIVVALIFLLKSIIIVPIASIKDAMAQLADGDGTVDVPYTKKIDEMGQMAQAVLVFKKNKIKADQLGAEQEQQRRHQAERAEKVDQFTKDFDKNVTDVIQSLHQSSGAMKETASNMKAIAEQAQHETSSIAAATEQSAMNMDSVSAASGELMSAITEISEQVRKSSAISGEAVAEVTSAAEQIQSLAEAAERIGEVVTLISGIAEQTNLLALNATIEAARAAAETGQSASMVLDAASELSKQATVLSGAVQGFLDKIRA